MKLFSKLQFFEFFGDFLNWNGKGLVETSVKKGFQSVKDHVGQFPAYTLGKRRI